MSRRHSDKDGGFDTAVLAVRTVIARSRETFLAA